LSVAANALIATVNEVPAAGMLKDVTVGAAVSAKAIVVEALWLAETFPAASLAHAYSVLAPAVAKE